MVNPARVPLSVLEQLPAAVWTCAADGQLTWYNAEAVALWGRSPSLRDPAERYTGALGLLTLEGRPIDPEQSWAARALRDGCEYRDCEVVVERPDGTQRTVLVQARPLLDDEGRISGAINVMTDGTVILNRRSRDFERAERASRHLAAIVASSDDAIIGKDLESRVTSWNDSATRLFGYEPSEIIGRPVTVLIPAHMHDEEPRIISRIRRGEPIQHYETVRVHKDGHLIEISLTVSPIKDGNGKIIGASKIVRDIGPQKREQRLLADIRAQLEHAKTDLEERVQERTASLAAAISQLEEFSYTVSHDLRAPLRAMRVYSRALIEDFGDKFAEIPEAANYLERISANASRLDRMILDVLTFSRVARSEMTMEVVDLDSLVRELVSHYPSMNPPAGLVEINPLLPVFGHAPSVSQTMSNLLTNAVKFVSAGVVPAVRVWTEARDGRVRVFVRDNGVGIPPRLRHRLFQMFERVHPDDGIEGHGVGLAIVKKAVERMNGTLGVESDGTQGTTFWVELPGSAIR